MLNPRPSLTLGPHIANLSGIFLRPYILGRGLYFSGDTAAGAQLKQAQPCAEVTRDRGSASTVTAGNPVEALLRSPRASPSSIPSSRDGQRSVE